MTPSLHTRLEPKLVTVLREGYSWRLFLHDLGAGVTVGVVALPLAIAFAVVITVGNVSMPLLITTGVVTR